jgi:hypothetical protein
MNTGTIMDDVAPRLREASTILASRAWFVTPDVPLRTLWGLVAAHKAGDFNTVDKVMTALVHRDLKNIERQTLEAFPARARILKAAFKAHLKKCYELSIPAMLAQADGMCFDLFGAKLYTRRKGVPVTAEKIDALNRSEFEKSILEPLRISSALSASDNEAKLQPDVLSRHLVLHGISIDYATELNAYRAISLLAFLATTEPNFRKLDAITPEQIAAFKSAIAEAFKDFKLKPETQG